MQADYVIVGAGSAGCVLANRLTEDPGTRVVLIEAGGRDWNPLIHIPAGFHEMQTHNGIRQGFVYRRCSYITSGDIANNAEIEVIWNRWQAVLEPLRSRLNPALGQSWQEWEIPREAPSSWPAEASKLHSEWWAARITRQKET